MPLWIQCGILLRWQGEIKGRYSDDHETINMDSRSRLRIESVQRGIAAEGQHEEQQGLGTGDDYGYPG